MSFSSVSSAAASRLRAAHHVADQFGVLRADVAEPDRLRIAVEHGGDVDQIDRRVVDDALALLHQPLDEAAQAEFFGVGLGHWLFSGRPLVSVCAAARYANLASGGEQGANLMTDQAAIGFVGIGAMGWPMAANLVRRQFPLTVYDLDRARQDHFVQAHQSRAASSLADLGKDTAVIVTMLPTGRDVRDVLLAAEDGRACERAQAGRDRRRHELVGPGGHARACGHPGKARDSVDAPVSGGTRGAEAASLTIMIGSDDKAAVERVRPALEAMGQRLFGPGGSGTGHAMKALNNFVAGTNFLAAAEALVVGKRFGLEPSLMVEIINQSTGRNFSTEHVFPQHVLSRKFASGFQLGLLAKDVKIAADLADDLQAQAPVARLSRDLLALARDRLGATADHSAAIQYWEMLNGVTVGGEPEK